MRYAIVIGANTGEAGEPTLRFAERDAQRVGDVLTRLGNVNPEDVLTLLSPTAEGLERALATFRERVKLAGGAGAMVVVYYSGHADERTLHLAGARYPFARLKAGVRAIGADLSIFVMDACRSGGLLRAKGSTPVEPFAFDVRDDLATEGMAIITSSAENEDALESDRLEGGVFTHHLVTGLLGAADRSGDQRVSLAEVYRYAYDQTIAATSETRVVQHPAYAFDVHGHNEIILTHLDARGDRGRLRLLTPGRYLVFARTTGHEIVAELDARAGTDLWLKPGTYLVRRRESAAVYEKLLEVAPNQVTDVGDDSLARVPFRSAVRKGLGQSREALSLGAAIELTAPIVDQTGYVLAGALGVQLDFEDLALQLRVRYGQSSEAHERVTFTQHLLGLDAGIFHLFDVGPHGAGFGVRGGVDWFAQRLASDGDAPDADQIIGRVGPFGRLEIALGPVLTLNVDLGIEVYFINAAHLDGGSALAAHAILTSCVGLSGALP